MIPIIPIIPTYKVDVPSIPFYSQFSDIHNLSWQKIGCGITSLAMIIDYYSTTTISVDALLKEGVAAGAYDKNLGWIHAGLISLSKKYNLSGESYDVSNLTKEKGFSKLKTYLEKGPVMVSIHYKFNPTSPIPHLVVLNSIKDNIIYYNDPAEKSGQKKISITDFQKGWKNKFIVIRPVKEKMSVA